MKNLIHTDLVLDREGDQNSVFYLNYFVDNGNGMGFGKTVSFIGKNLEDVQQFAADLQKELEGLSIDFTLYSGRGFNQKRINIHDGKEV